MATKTEIVHKRSSVTGNIPTTSQLAFGELAVNTTDSKVFFKVNDGTERVVSLEPSAASGTISNNDVTTNSYVASGGQTDFVLTIEPRTENHVLVSINGVLQNPAVYSLNSLTITLATGTVSGDIVELRTFDTTVVSTTSAHAYKVFKYNITTSTTSITGIDANGETLSYRGSYVEVYVNGSRYVIGVDFTVNAAGDTITLGYSLESGDTVEIISLATVSILDWDIQKGLATLTGTTEQVADTYEHAVYRTVKYIVQMKSGANIHSTEMLVTHNGTNVYTTEYATLITNISLGTIDADLSGNNVRLLITPTQSSTTVKLKKIVVDA